jgi:exopolysaccharide production protein ExoY
LDTIQTVKKQTESLCLMGAECATTTEVPLWKRGLDYLCILFGLPVLLPAFGLIALWIKIVSPGPIFFMQERIGHLGRPFRCFKFRSMRAGADTSSHEKLLRDLIHSDRPMTKMDESGDQRLIPLARVIRASGLDELPQLINVLRGEMSIVGPRPCTPYEYENYLPWQKQRFETLPGLTGLWQVSGKNKTTFTEMIHLDIYYSKNKSMFLDLKIMWKTFSVLFGQVKESGVAAKK